MKQIKIYFFALLASLALGACSNNDDDNGASGNSENLNANAVTAGVPQEVTRIEFPKVKGGTSQIIVHKDVQYGVNYCTEYDLDKKSQRWSCYAVYKDNNCKNWDRGYWRNGINGQAFTWDGKAWGNNNEPFQTDPQISTSAQASTREYGSSSMPSQGIRYFQRGHIVASEDRICNMNVNGQTFYMTNMQPQSGDFNGGIWAKMETAIRKFMSYDYSLKHPNDTMYVCKGGTIDRDDYIMGKTTNGFIVPKYFFAAVLYKDAQKGYKAIGFWFEHKSYSSSEKLTDHVVNVAELEKLTGIDFFCNLPDDIERTVENRTKDAILSQWGLTTKN